MKNLTKILCALMVVFMISCAKEGAVGPAGANGTDGNANVMYSDWINTDAMRDTVIFSSYKYKMITETNITQDIIDKGVVLSYVKVIGISNEINAMPCVLSHASFRAFEGIPVLGKFMFRFYNFNSATTAPAAISTTNQFRYVVIKSTTHLRLAKPLTQMTYDEVCELYNIPK